MAGRPAIDPAIKAERQKLARKAWRENNKAKTAEIKKKSAIKRYAEDDTIRARYKQRAARNYIYRYEAAALANIPGDLLN